MAESAQPRPVVRSHLNLIVGPDDEVLQEQVGHIWTGDVLDLVVHRQPGQTVTETHVQALNSGPFHKYNARGTSGGDIRLQLTAYSTPHVLLGGDKAPANMQLKATDCCLENTCCFIWM